MSFLKKSTFLALLIAVGFAAQSCSKNNDVSSAADEMPAEETMISDAQDISEENLDNMDSSLSPEQAQSILNNLTTIYFGYDQSSLTAQEQSELDRVASALKALNSAEITIEGHADERGSNEYNLALGNRRANAVYDYLLNMGVDANQLNTVSFGEERPAQLGSSESAWSKNRRAELVR